MDTTMQLISVQKWSVGHNTAVYEKMSNFGPYLIQVTITDDRIYIYCFYKGNL